MIAGHFNNKYVATRIPYLILSLLLVPDIAGFTSHAPILWLGSAFFIVRQMITVAHGIKTKCSLGEFLPALLLSTFFVAALPSGPIFNGMKCWHSLRQNLTPMYSEGCYRLFEGTVYLFAIAGFIGLFVQTIDHMDLQILTANPLTSFVLLKLFAMPIASFFLLYATFYGYSRMAEGTALLFGFEVPQNFNKPYLARDLGDFWQRWHRSMADFVMQYIYLPLLVTTSRTKLSLVLAFVFMGLWHNISWSFLVWGLGHGVALAMFLPWARTRKLPHTFLRILSLVYVVTLSSIAHGTFQP